MKIKIINALTNEIVLNTTIESSRFDDVQKAHEILSAAYPDCTVSFSLDNGDFICGMARNQMKDELAYVNGKMTWQEYCDKWYKGDPAGCNQD